MPEAGVPWRRLALLRDRAQRAGRLRGCVVNRADEAGRVVVRVRLTRADVEFYPRAREDVLALVSAVSRVVELHRPVDGGGLSSDPSRPVLRCGHCMGLWPCATVRTLYEVLG